MRKLTADLVQESTSTSGTGTVTLTQLAGWVRFSDRFNVGDLVEYSIEDGSNKEVGQGTVGANHTLARTKLRMTLVSGTTNTAPVSPITLSGNAATVRAVISEEVFSTLLKLEYAAKAANFAAADGFAYIITANGVTATLPSGITGDRMRFTQGAAGVTGFIVDPGAKLINGNAGAMTVDLPDFAFSIVYINDTYGWKVEA